MPDNACIAYQYDGSYAGFLCCVFESYDRREIPIAILRSSAEQLSLYPTRYIETDPEKAGRVEVSLEKKLSPQVSFMVETAYLSCKEEIGLQLLLFIRLGYRVGPRIVTLLTDSTVNAIDRTVQSVLNEAHYYKEFLRFSERNAVLVSEIEPKNKILSLIAPHYCDRFPEEHLVIYDRTHREALFYQPYHSVIVPLEEFHLNQAESQEREFQRLWRRYYQTAGIEARYNPKCRMTMMPKRYWNCLTEFQDGKELGAQASMQLFENTGLLPENQLHKT